MAVSETVFFAGRVRSYTGLDSMRSVQCAQCSFTTNADCDRRELKAMAHLASAFVSGRRVDRFAAVETLATQ